MSRFASKELRTIDLGDGEWIKIPSALSYNTVLTINSEKSSESDVAKAMLIACIKEWNLKDDEGNLVELSEENILNLNIQTITQITEEITPLFTNNQNKKK